MTVTLDSVLRETADFIARVYRALGLDRSVEFEAAAARLEAMLRGPYDVRQCRGHWHITAGGDDVVDKSHYDEASARAEAARRNAAHQLEAEGLRDQLTAVQRKYDRAHRALVDIREYSCDSWDYECAVDALSELDEC